jgi:hypothetical protein
MLLLPTLPPIRCHSAGCCRRAARPQEVRQEPTATGILCVPGSFSTGMWPVYFCRGFCSEVILQRDDQGAYLTTCRSTTLVGGVLVHLQRRPASPLIAAERCTDSPSTMALLRQKAALSNLPLALLRRHYHGWVIGPMHVPSRASQPSRMPSRGRTLSLSACHPPACISCSNFRRALTLLMRTLIRSTAPTNAQVRMASLCSACA